MFKITIKDFSATVEMTIYFMATVISSEAQRSREIFPIKRKAQSDNQSLLHSNNFYTTILQPLTFNFQLYCTSFFIRLY